MSGAESASERPQGPPAADDVQGRLDMYERALDSLISTAQHQQQQLDAAADLLNGMHQEILRQQSVLEAILKAADAPTGRMN